MTFALVFEQTLNGLQLGVMLFLMAAGLTLVLGIMNVVNLAHGSLYMVGAYLTVAAFRWTGSYLLGVALGLTGTLVVGMLMEIIVLRALYARDHLDQVLATFGLILFFNELVAIIWGRAALFASGPSWLAGHINLFTGSRYPLYRAAIIAVGLVVAELGVNIRLLYPVVFGCGAALAGLAGLMAGPIYNVQPGMGELILIQVFVVIVIGGIGSIRGALVGAVIVGIVDTLGRAYLKPLLGTLISPTAAEAAGPALASMLIYLPMAGVLALRPPGLFVQRGS